MNDDLLNLEDVRVEFPGRRVGLSREAPAIALDAVDLQLRDGETVGIVGESGSGKSTLSRVILGLQRPQRGVVRFRGRPLDTRDRESLVALRREVQAVFQDPYGSLDPRMTAAACVAETLAARSGRRDPKIHRPRVDSALRDVGLDDSLAARYPHQLSGGQCQRVAIARAMIGAPRLLVCDEAVSALDVSVQAQIINLLRDVRARAGMAMLFISHNIAVVRMLCDRIVVLHRGRVVEQGPTEELLEAPRDAYTRALIDSIPDPFGSS
jgi:ABC-type microcin C transport system duplicated ATPase subunit YejF